MEPDAVLVKAVVAGDTAAYETLVRRYERAVLAVALSVLKDYHGAEDASQETFVVAYRKLGQLRQPAAFGGWLMRIARRQALRLRRMRRPEQPVVDVAARGEDRPSETAEHLLAAVARLPKHERQAVMMHYFDGLSTAEAAEASGQLPGTIRKQLSRARERLRARLGGLNDE
ncbi:MAG: RNA polymerase sigma factor [bacterium]|nr:RNA polymerase sigma factor [bacterium]